MNRLSLMGIAVTITLASTPGNLARAKENLPSNLGPDQWVTCKATYPGTSRHYYAYWNPGWPSPMNTQAYAVNLCNTWHSGVGQQIPPIAGSHASSPHQYRPRVFAKPRAATTLHQRLKPVQTPTPTPGCGTPASGVQNQNTC